MAIGNSVLDVKQKVRSLIGDPDGDFATDAYLLPLLNLAYETAVHYLQNTCSPFITKLQVVPAVSMGTTSLQQFQTAGEPLDGLINPTQIEYKQVGQPESNYVFMQQKLILPAYSPASAPSVGPPFRCIYWEYRAYVVYLTALPYNCDIRVRGDFRPQALTKDSDLLAIHPLMGAAMAFATGALVGGERQNSNYKADYSEQAIQILDNISSELVRQTQSSPNRIGRMTRGNREGNGWNGS